MEKELVMATPGPWTAVPHNPHEPLSNPYVQGPNVAICQVYRGGYGETTPEAEANARLIAAAPEMLDKLAALQGILDSFTGEIENDSDAATERDLETFDAIVAKLVDLPALLARIVGAVIVGLILGSPAYAQQMQTTTTYSASVAGAKDCIAINLTVTRTTSSSGTRTWVSLTERQCAPGSSDAFSGPIIAQASQVIPDSDYIIGRSGETLTTQTSAGMVNVTWLVTSAVHQTYSAQWVNDTNGTSTKQQEASDTKSATPTGTITGKDVSGRSGYVITATSATGTK